MLTSSARIDWTVSAPQLGKSLILGAWLLGGAWRDGGRYPQWPSWWLAPTFEQARQGFLRYVVSPARSAGILKSHTESVPLRAQLVNGSMIEARSWDRPDGLYGPTVARIGVDEFGLMTDAAWAAMSSRTRETALYGLGQIRGTGNVQEVGGTAESLYRIAEGKRDGWACRTWTWRDRALSAPCTCEVDGLEVDDAVKHATDCPRGVYLEGLADARAAMSEAHFRQLYEAEWLDWSALPVYTFDRAAHVDAEQAEYDPALPVELSCDFNVDPMCWIVGQHKGDLAWDVDEIVIPGGATTAEACREFIRRYPDGKRTEVIVYGDASGASRRTASKQSDYDIIREALGGHYSRFRMQVPASNPSVVDRINTVNARLRNAKGEVRYRIHPRCTHLIDDRVRVSWKPGTRDIDKRDKNRTHASDASDYRLAALYRAGSYSTRAASHKAQATRHDTILMERF